MAQLDIKIAKDYRALELGFLQGVSPSSYKRLLSFAALNAARTYAKPMKAAAPKGPTGNLARSVRAKAGRYSRPSGVVGPLYAGKGSGRNPFYRHFVTNGVSGIRRTKTGSVQGRRVNARPFVMNVVEQSSNQQRAIDAFYATIEAFYNNDVFRNRILRFRRGNQR